MDRHTLLALLLLLLLLLLPLVGAKCKNVPLLERSVVYFRGGCSVDRVLQPAIHWTADTWITPDAFKNLDPPFSEGDCIAFAERSIALQVQGCCVRGEERGCILVVESTETHICNRIFNERGIPYSEEEVTAWNAR